MIKLAYTDEMKHQDKLWNDANEDLEIMERLQNQIVNEFKEKTNLDFYFSSYFFFDEYITECYESEENACNGGEPIFHVGYCDALISELQAL